MPRKAWRKCVGCGEIRHTSMSYHRFKKNGVKQSCGSFRLMDRDSDFVPPKKESHT